MKCCESVGCAEEVLTVVSMGDGVWRVNKGTEWDILLHSSFATSSIALRKLDYVAAFSENSRAHMQIMVWLVNS